MGKSESEVQQLIQIEAPKLNCILERNNSGAMTDPTGRPVRFGLGNISSKHAGKMKSSDLIGVTTVGFLGKQLGIFTAIEAKAEDWDDGKKLNKHEEAQANYIMWVRSRGGIAGFANSVECFRNLIDTFLRNLKS